MNASGSPTQGKGAIGGVERDHHLADSERRHRTAVAAFYRAEARGFAPGGELEDWLAAERELEAHASASIAAADPDAVREATVATERAATSGESADGARSGAPAPRESATPRRSPRPRKSKRGDAGLGGLA